MGSDAGVELGAGTGLGAGVGAGLVGSGAAVGSVDGVGSAEGVASGEPVGAGDVPGAVGDGSAVPLGPADGGLLGSAGADGSGTGGDGEGDGSGDGAGDGGTACPGVGVGPGSVGRVPVWFGSGPSFGGTPGSVPDVPASSNWPEGTGNGRNPVRRDRSPVPAGPGATTGGVVGTSGTTTSGPPDGGAMNGVTPAGGMPSATVAEPLPIAARIGNDEVPASNATVNR
ncbi:hypothetical protein ACFP2T_22555 [Plantactinospora solaniradicis]|uniref:Uncharacterized protein n=1 Tax=Plantactinospora solaniradicis TaxID=1723736 RepID=A0ABW1KAX8_9ACTN